jgi:RNA polymerase sigma-70 factor (ECF subfamily)
VGTAEQRFRVLYDRSYSKVLGYALRRADSRDDAFDVVAETFRGTARHPLPPSSTTTGS